jgi:hypothetical protein
MRKVIYISGAITTDPDWKKKFLDTEIQLRKWYPDAIILSPLHIGEMLEAKNPGKELTDKDYMDEDLKWLPSATDIYQIHEDVLSDGSQIELSLASYYNINFLPIDQNPEKVKVFQSKTKKRKVS